MSVKWQISVWVLEGKRGCASVRRAARSAALGLSLGQLGNVVCNLTYLSGSGGCDDLVVGWQLVFHVLLNFVLTSGA